MAAHAAAREPTRSSIDVERRPDPRGVSSRAARDGPRSAPARPAGDHTTIGFAASGCSTSIA
jgi:hypothetical protein